MLVGYREQRIDPSLEPRKGPRGGESGGPWSSVISVEVVPLLVGGDIIDDANVPIDNSATEREFQNVAKLRLNVLFAGSTEGAHRACVLLGIIATCRTVGVPVQAYLTWAFERLGTHRDVFALQLEEMTPAAFKKTLG